MFRTLFFLCVAAVGGVVGSTTVTVVGFRLLHGTELWRGIYLPWIVGIPVAIVFAVVLGFPAVLLFQRLGLSRWWQFVLGGALIAVPAWIVLAQPFDSQRWQHAGFFDSLNYLGSGALAGLCFWWLQTRMGASTAGQTGST